MRTLKFIRRIFLLCVKTKGHPVLCFTFNGQDNGVVMESGKELATEKDIEWFAKSLEDYAVQLRKGNITIVLCK